jgi:phosphatidylinositol alpha-mannosyltransferase
MERSETAPLGVAAATENRKIGIVSPYDWSYPGGVRDHITHLAEELRRMGHDVLILTPASGPQRHVKEEYVYKLGRTTPIPVNGSIARVTLVPALARRVKEVLSHEQFDVLHIHEPLAPSLPLTALRLSRTVNVGTFHASAPRNLSSTPHLAYTSARPILRHFFNRLDGRIAVSTAAQRFITRYFPGDYRLIPNGVDLRRFGVLAAPRPELMDGKRNVLFVGRIERRKGLKFLLRAIPAIREHCPNTRFIIVGEGNMRLRYEEFVRQHRWPDVLFTGYVPDDDKPGYYASCDLFCAPSTGGESQGVVLLEAMAAGKPVVASAIDGYRSVLTNGSEGLLVPPRDSSALAEAVIQLLHDDVLCLTMGQHGRSRAAEYSWPRVAARIAEYYDDLLERRRHSNGRSFYGSNGYSATGE